MIGFLNINKPAGMTSAKVVALVKRKLNLDKSTKIGHMGTLDMLASGVLPLAIGHATRLFNFMLSKRKYYRAEFTFGYMTDTLDNDGKVVSTSDRIPSKVEIEAVLPQFLGEIQQIPPLYSAKHINGERASNLARSGKEVSLEPSCVHIFEFNLVSFDGENAVFDIECSAGTYIRSLCRDLANTLNTVATMTSLIRTRAGIFTLKDSISIDEVSEESLLPPEVVLSGVKQLRFETEAELKTLYFGQKLVLDKPEGLYAFFVKDKLCGLCEISTDSIARMKTWL